MSCSLSFASALIGAFGYYWCSSPAPRREAPLGHVVATVLIGIPVLGNLLLWGALPFMRRPVEMKARPGRVAVVTTCVPAVELSEMVERTVAALVRFRVDHDTWLLDEGDDPVLREACARLGARVLHLQIRKALPDQIGSVCRWLETWKLQRVARPVHRIRSV